MTVVEILGYIGAVAIGVSLGLIGGGGSILTVPVLVYLLGVSPVLATAYSLFIVGFSSLVGGIKYARQGLVNFKTGLVFAVPAFLSVYLTRRYLMPWLPDVWFTTEVFTLTKNTGILLLFAILMVAASISMIKKSKTEEVEVKTDGTEFNFILILIEGAVVGMLTGLVGAGGGFLIIPALVLFAKLPMKMAIGTSLLIIAAKSLLGFIGDIQAGENIDWAFLLTISALAGTGIFIGMAFSKKVDGAQLKKGFGWFVLIMGVFMIIKETLLK
ncbi:sulfite exporter TauE/SafE family protein [Fulvivirga lutimaris]|uniref:sulfite exporter TauE/SafE family protein n=1 Tax=Fulvivirga lutimaris TaxID=1819566 RepID=UPI0012BBB5C4|nr:sulfite exporter TauE/SafE family protein [Fulvivirga lutimaris]MTI39828.1 sulfite exporter TauE/SafE family protein [Fulvivirga lutimaris]